MCTQAKRALCAVRLLFLLALLSGPVYAATVSLSLDFPSPGEFELYAEEIDGDNAGIAFYGVVLNGGVLTLDHVSPNSTFAIDNRGVIGPAGFTWLRSADGSTDVSALQNVINPTPHLIYGFGQTANSFANLGLTDVTGLGEQLVWDARLLLATGTWESQTPSIDFDNTQTFAHVFVEEGSPEIMEASTEIVVCSCGPEFFPGPSSTISMQLPFEDGTGRLSEAIEIFDGHPPEVEILDISFLSNDFDLFGAEVNEVGPPRTSIDLTIDVEAARKLPLGTDVGAELILETNYGDISYSLVAVVPEPSSAVTLAGLMLLGTCRLHRS